jgi:ethanolamine utilization protein EutP
LSHRILLIGGVGSGKTTLKQRLLREALVYRKTQVLEFSRLFVDCPGEYLEVPRYYHVLIDASHRAAEVWAVQDATRRRSFFPPNFAKAFAKPVVGIVTKIDHDKADPAAAAAHLYRAGIAAPLYLVSALSGEGIAALAARIGSAGEDPA